MTSPFFTSNFKLMSEDLGMVKVLKDIEATSRAAVWSSYRSAVSINPVSYATRASAANPTNDKEREDDAALLRLTSASQSQRVLPNYESGKECD